MGAYINLDFDTFLTSYKFCAERWEDAVMLQEHYVLKSVKGRKLRCDSAQHRVRRCQ